MFKGIIPTGTTITENINIPMNVVINTGNTRYDASASAVELRGSGYYDIKVSLPLTNASATPLTLQLFANGQPINEGIAHNGITVTTGIVTFTILDVVRVVATPFGDTAEISVRLIGGTAELADDGVIIIEQRK